MRGHIVAMGGGGFLTGDPASPLDDLMLELAGVTKPHVVFLPTATGDADRAVEAFQRGWSARPCTTDVAYTFGVPERPAEQVGAADVVIVAGGNTANMLAIWRLHGVDKALRDRWESGAVLGGVSAGANCWFEACVTDSFSVELDGLPDGLGFLGWRSPARSTSLAQITAGVIGDPARWMAETGIAPKSLDQILAARPASVQDRWFARLYWLKPLAILGLAIAAIVPNAERLAAYLGIGASSFSGRPMLLGAVSSAVALLAGLSLAVRPAARCALLVLWC